MFLNYIFPAPHTQVTPPSLKLLPPGFNRGCFPGFLPGPASPGSSDLPPSGYHGFPPFHVLMPLGSLTLGRTRLLSSSAQIPTLGRASAPGHPAGNSPGGTQCMFSGCPAVVKCHQYTWGMFCFPRRKPESSFSQHSLQEGHEHESRLSPSGAPVNNSGSRAAPGSRGCMAPIFVFIF